MTSVSVLAPFQGDGAERTRNWEWLRARYGRLYPDWEVCEGSGPDGVWCKADALQDAVDHTSGEVLVIVDADVLVHPNVLPTAVRNAVRHPWVVPHDRVRRLSKEATAKLCGAVPVDWIEAADTEGPEQRVCPGGGLVVIRREVYEQAGGMDPRFIGWGYEDSAWAAQLDTLAGDPHWGSALMWHLWHPSARKRHGDPHPRGAVSQLRKRYVAARGDRAAVNEIVAERPDREVC